MTELTDGLISLRLVRDSPANPTEDWLRSLRYDIVFIETDERVGGLDLRLGYTTHVVRYGGHIGYGVDEMWRGRGFAAKACRLVKSVARSHGMDVIWITCVPDNIASRRTCEAAGGTMVEVVDLPQGCKQYLRGDRQVCRYRFVLY